MGFKEFFKIKMVYFRLYPQYSSIPFFHSDGINRLPLINLYSQDVVEFPSHLITVELKGSCECIPFLLII